MLIREITLRNLLSFGPDTPPLEMRPLNVLIGPNGSGKSNFIEALSLLQAAPYQLTKPINEGGGIGEWIWKGGRDQLASIAATIVLRCYEDGYQEHMNHFMEIRNSKGRLTLENETIISPSGVPTYIRNGACGPSLFSDTDLMDPIVLDAQMWPDDRSIVSPLKDPINSSDIDKIGSKYERILIYREWSFGRDSAMRRPQKADLHGDFLAEDLSNLFLVLSRLCLDPSCKKRLLELLSDLYPNITDLVPGVVEGMVQLRLFEGQHSTPATRLSDGTLRYLCLLAILCHPEPPLLICIEEPELGLHPDVIPTIADLLKEASERTQLIVTTHSDALVDAFSDSPEDVVVCERGERGTVMRRLDADDLNVWLKDYSLGNLWRSGQIGGNRW